ncbi:MAG: HAD family hydrolase [Faecousia sp.]
MIKLIASDIDGTLLQNGETAVSERFFRQARRLMAQGVALCAASGRQYSSLRRLFAPVAEGMYFLCENGAVVYGPGSPGKLLSKTVINRDISLELCHDILAILDCELLISGANMSYLCPKTADYIDHIRYFVGNNTTILQSPEEMPEDFVKISAYYRPGAALIEPVLASKWQDRFQTAIAGACWLDFTLADKATGIRALCAALGISPEEAMAFGDNYNDVPMLDAVGRPYLMSSAAQPLRQRYPTQCARPEDVLETL